MLAYVRAVIAGAVALTTAGLILGTTALAPAADERALLTTLERGLQYRESLLQRIAGLCTIEGWQSDRQIAAWGKLLPGREVLGRSLNAVRFVYEQERWRLEIAHLFSNGAEHFSDYAPVPCGPTIDAKGLNPVTIWDVSDGTRRYHYDSRGVGFTEPLGPGSDRRIASVLRHLLLYVNEGVASKLFDREEVPELSGPEVLADTRCYRVAWYRSDQRGGGYMVAIWVAPEKGFAVVKFQDLMIAGDTRNGQRYVVECRSLKEVSPGLWLPIETVWHTYTYYGDDPGVWRSSELVRVASWHTTPQVETPGGVFWLPFPLGTRLEEKGHTGPSERFEGNTDQVLAGFRLDGPPPARDGRMEKPLKSSLIMENAWP